MGNGKGSQRLVLTLTHACNLRCPYCPLVKTADFMSPEVARRAADIFFSRNPPDGALVKFFGGEPLLSYDLMKALVPRLRQAHGGRGLSFFVSTNSTLLADEAVLFFQRNPDMEVAVSSVLNPRRLLSLPNFHLNIPIPPHLADGLGRYVARLLKLGIRRLNFLPGYYVRWGASQLKALERGFEIAARLIRRWRDQGLEVEVKNLRNWAPTPLYNHGMVVAPDGDVFPSNLVFSETFHHLQPRLRLGSVLEPDRIDWARAEGVSYADLLRENLDREAHRSTLAVDGLLTRFVEALA